MKTVGTWQRVLIGKWVGQRWDWFVEQVEDCPVGGVPERLRQCLQVVPGSVREAKNPVTH
jgi:hypothetical protein